MLYLVLVFQRKCYITTGSSLVRHPDTLIPSVPKKSLPPTRKKVHHIKKSFPLEILLLGRRCLFPFHHVRPGLLLFFLRIVLIISAAPKACHREESVRGGGSTYVNLSSPSYASVSKVVGPQPASNLLDTLCAFEVVPTRPSPSRPASRDSLKLEGWDHYTRPAMAIHLFSSRQARSLARESSPALEGWTPPLSPPVKMDNNFYPCCSDTWTLQY